MLEVLCCLRFHFKLSIKEMHYFNYNSINPAIQRPVAMCIFSEIAVPKKGRIQFLTD